MDQAQAVYMEPYDRPGPVTSHGPCVGPSVVPTAETAGQKDTSPISEAKSEGNVQEDIPSKSESETCGELVQTILPTYPPVAFPHAEYLRLQELAKTAESLSIALQAREKEVSELQDKIVALQTEYSKNSKEVEDYCHTLEGRCRAYEWDNTNLRAYITRTQTPQAQLRSNAHYADRLQGLNRHIQEWAAELFIDIPKKQKLKDQAGAELLRMLSNVSVHGENTSTLLKTNITKAHQIPHKRIALARHIFALYLSEWVFKPLAFGLSHGESRRLRIIEGNMISNGRITVMRKLTSRTRFHSFIGDSSSIW